MSQQTVHIFYLKQENRLSDQEYNFFYTLLPPIFQKKISEYKHWESAQASMLGKMILFYAFKKLYPTLSLNDIFIGEKDRPIVNTPVDFNISHSGAYVFIAIANQARVGIDVEKHRIVDYTLFRKYFSESEWKYIEESEHPVKTFFDLWAIKESAIKCDGRGVEILQGTHIDSNDSETIICSNKIFRYHSFRIDESYSCSICCSSVFRYEITELSVQQLYPLLH